MNKSIKFSHSVGIILGVIALIIGMSFQGISQSMSNGGGGSTAFVGNSSSSNGGGGDVFTSSNNTLSASNTFNGATIFNGTSTFNGNATASNLTVRSNFVSTNSVDGTVTNYLGGTRFYSRKTADTKFFDMVNTNGTLVGTCFWDALTGFNLGSPGVQFNFKESSSQLILFAGVYQWDANGFTDSGNFAVTGTLNTSSNVTFGSFSGNTETHNGSTVTFANTMNMNTSTLWVSNQTAAFNTNSTAVGTEGFVAQAIGTTQVPLIARGAASHNGALFSVQNSAKTVQFQVMSNATIANIGANASASMTANSINLINSGGQISLQNNTATANSSLLISGGSATTANIQTPTTGYWYPRGGQRVNKVLTTTNYTFGISDYAVSFKPNQAGTTITGLLPAATIHITNGWTYLVKDAQQSAATTNIVLIPSGSDTVDRATSKTISANGGALQLIYDGANWETY